MTFFPALLSLGGFEGAKSCEGVADSELMIPHSPPPTPRRGAPLRSRLWFNSGAARYHALPGTRTPTPTTPCPTSTPTPTPRRANTPARQPKRLFPLRAAHLWPGLFRAKIE